MAIREGVWHCTSCGTENRGSAKICESCHDPQSIADGEAPKPKKGAAVVKAAAALAQATAGPDWSCAFCGKDNTAQTVNCTQCGHAEDEGDTSRPVGIYRSPQGPEVASLSFVNEVPALKFASLGILAGLGVLALCAMLCAGWIFSPSDVSGTVTSKSWECYVAVEESSIEQGEGFELPQGARILSEETRVHHQETDVIGTEKRTRTVEKKVKVGTKKVVLEDKPPIDLGNGFFKDQEEEQDVFEVQNVKEDYEVPITRKRDVKKPYYHYERTVWKTKAPRKTAGIDSEPYWPPTEIATNERLGERRQVLTVIFTTTSGSKVPYVIPNADVNVWRQFSPGQRCILKIDKLGILHRVQTVEQG